MTDQQRKVSRRIVLGDEQLEQELDLLVQWHCGSSRVDAVAFLLRHVSPRLRATNPADWVGSKPSANAAPSANPSQDNGNIDLNSLFL